MSSSGASTAGPDLAEQLVGADGAERQRLIAERAGELDAQLAARLKATYDAHESSDPARALAAADALTAVAGAVIDPAVQAIADWTGGLAALDRGELEVALQLLTAAEARFLALGQPHDAARTLVGKLIVLAITGQYAAATATGTRARDVFVAHGNLLSAGKIEQNLGNIAARLEQHAESERWFRAAHERFLTLGDEQAMAQIENNLATAQKWQHRLREASDLYAQALVRAANAGLEVTQAEIECNLGILGLFQGQYAAGLDSIERAMRRYAALSMDTRTTLTELELADAWLELNLAPEAIELYERVVPVLETRGMRSELARALANLGRGLLALGRPDEARTRLASARALYAAEGNPAGAALVDLTAAELAFSAGDADLAATLAQQAIAPLSATGALRRTLQARWLHAEARRRIGADDADALLRALLADAEASVVPEIEHACHTSLGLLAAARGDVGSAAESFERAIAIIEALRAPLPSEEFRAAFIANKLVPYGELVRLYLAQGTPTAIAAALRAVERARARALLDMVGGALRVRTTSDDPRDAELLQQIEDLREELNWLYSQINRPPDDGGSRAADMVASLHDATRGREQRVAELTRRVRQRAPVLSLATNATDRVALLDIARLQAALGAETALVEYGALDGELFAFVVTGDSVRVVRHLAREEQVDAAIARFRFQIGSLQHGAARLRGHMDELVERARGHMQLLYDLVLRPLESAIGDRQLIVVPHRALHYLPFHALHDGSAYVIELREVSYAPSAAILERALGMPSRRIERALLLGVPDERAPRVQDEVVALGALFPDGTTLLGDDATRAALSARASGADLLHLACHGQFRPDNPLFSALRLADGWLTVRDVYELDLHAELVTLSACETGMSHVAPGDELLGIARGFMSSGTPTLVVSLWTVDDDTTLDLMLAFYAGLRSGQRPATALRTAQILLLADQPHPFFWSAFSVIGRP